MPNYCYFILDQNLRHVAFVAYLWTRESNSGPKVGEFISLTTDLSAKRKSNLFLKKWANPGLFFVYFRSPEQISLQFLQQIYVKNCHSSIWCQDLNPRPSERESLPISTRPGLPPQKDLFFSVIFRHPLIKRRAYCEMFNEIGTRTLHIYSVQLCFQDFAIEL